MAYTLFSQSFGTAYANKQVCITNTVTGAPATVQSAATGGVISTQGFATLNGTGDLSVYLDNGTTWVATVVNPSSLTSSGSNTAGTTISLPVGGGSYSATANITLAASATDVLTIAGSATNTIYLTRLTVSGVQTTAGAVDIRLIKRSAVNTAGTSAAVTAVPMDSNVKVTSATLLSYSANPTGLGTAVGTLRRRYVLFPAVASVIPSDLAVFDFAQKGQPLVLRGTSELLALNFGGTTVTGGVVNATVEWFEL